MSGDHVEPHVYEPERCGLTAALGVIGGKWKPLLWWRLHLGVCRFNELRRCFPMISHKVMTEQLRAMESDGIVRRTAHPEVPPRVEYELTELGETLEPLILDLSHWGEAFLERAVEDESEDGTSS